MFHLFKKSRVYDGTPYRGPTSNYSPAEYVTIEEALSAQKSFTERNPVGWDVYDAKTGELVDNV